MVSQVLPALLLLLAAWHPPANGQGQGNCPSSAQPVATSLDPPSGTTGDDLRASSNYTVSGATLDAVGSIEVSGIGTVTTIRSRNSTSITFNIPEARPRLNPGDILNATVSLIPSNRNCLVRNFSVMLFPICKSFTVKHY